MSGLLLDTRDDIAVLPSIDPAVTHIRTAGRSVVGVGGGLHTRMLSAPSPVKPEHTPGPGGTWWLLTPEGDIWFEQLGAVGNLLTTDDQPAIQATFDFAAGHSVRGRKKSYRLDRPVVTEVMNFQGIGKGSAVIAVAPDLSAVLGDDFCTRFVANFPDGDVIVAKSQYPSIFRDAQIDSMVPRTSGAGIFLSGPDTAAIPDLKTQTGSIIDNVAFDHQFECIVGYGVRMPSITNCFGTSWKANGVRMSTPNGTESSFGAITRCFWWGNSGSTTQESCIKLEVGYGSVDHNLLLGAAIGTLIKPKDSSAGSPRVTDNWIENQGIAGTVAYSGGGGFGTAMMVIASNSYSNIECMASYVASISLPDYPAGTDFSVDTRIESNVHRHNVIKEDFRFILLQSGRNVVVSGEQFENINPAHTAPAISTLVYGSVGAGTQLISPVQVLDCTFTGRFDQRYKFDVPDRIVVRDQQAITHSQYPVNVADGSVFYVSDGHSAAYPTNLAILDHGVGATSWKNGGLVYCVRP